MIARKLRELKRIGYTESAIMEYATREHVSRKQAIEKLFDHEQKFMAKQETLEVETLELI